jgi:TRAP-type mannitol/chloroaromatic compound transport system permease small subunit
MEAITRMSATIDRISESIGKWSGWLNTALVLIITSDVFLRYMFNETSSWIVELEWHVFALIFLLGAPHALKADKHVRVDVFYSRFSPKKKALVNFIGALILLIPWSLILIKTSYFYAENAFVIGEGSPEPDGLPARYVIKFAITAGFILLLLQGVSEAVRAGRVLFAKNED